MIRIPLSMTSVSALAVMLVLTAQVSADDLVYRLSIVADFREASPGECVPVSARVEQESWLLRELSWRDTGTMGSIEADGELVEEDGRWTWRVPDEGGELSYCLEIDDTVGERHVARHAEDWVVMRGDDLFPAVRSVTWKGARSDTRLRFRLPGGWGSAARYAPGTKDDTFMVDDPDRRLDRPTGWLALGRLGVRRDDIAGTHVAVAGPVNQGVRRMDLLALMAYALPEFTSWFDTVPERLLVVSARDGMWRGALSGPGSLYLHADRPLVSENATSPLLHELVHVVMQRQAVAGQDWIDEGLAEYLGLLMLRESGGITQDRFKAALAWQRRWAAEADELGGRHSRGPETARAVGVFAALHEELGKKAFRAFVREVSAPGPELTLDRLREIAERVHDGPVESLPAD